MTGPGEFIRDHIACVPRLGNAAPRGPPTPLAGKWRTVLRVKGKSGAVTRAVLVA
jgi:hypothetical protein